MMCLPTPEVKGVCGAFVPNKEEVVHGGSEFKVATIAADNLAGNMIIVWGRNREGEDGLVGIVGAKERVSEASNNGVMFGKNTLCEKENVVINRVSIQR